MKGITYLCMVAFVSALALVGCEKKEEAPKVPEVPKEAPKAP